MLAWYTTAEGRRLAATVVSVDTSVFPPQVSQRTAARAPPAAARAALGRRGWRGGVAGRLAGGSSSAPG
jgi:hypothetical protein